MSDYRPVGWRRQRRRWKRGCGWQNVTIKTRTNPIRVHRLRHKITHRELAEAVGVHVRTVRRWQSGPFPPIPSVRLLIKIAWHFRLSNPGGFISEYADWLAAPPMHLGLRDEEYWRSKLGPVKPPPPPARIIDRTTRLPPPWPGDPGYRCLR